MNNSISDIAIAICFISIALAVLTIVFAVLLNHIYRAGEARGVVIGELNEMRRRDEMNVRARERADVMLLPEIRGGNEFTQEEIDV